MWMYVVAACVALGQAGGERHAFYRSLARPAAAAAGGGGRRMFGGRAAQLEEWGAVCALLDRYWSARCSGAVLAPRWALTAAHCVSPRLAYVAYNTRRVRAHAADAAPVHYLYRHPGYRVRLEDEGRGEDVTLLQHDVGLVRTRADMRLAAPPAEPPLRAMLRYDATRLLARPVDVLGFGRAEWDAADGEQLHGARLRVEACARAAWQRCVCGAAAGGAPSGVCAGDSGGPVLYAGAQVALTSMGPVECEEGRVAPAADAAPLTSVFTALREYVPLLNRTVRESDAAFDGGAMTRLSSGAGASPVRWLTALTAATAFYL